MNQEDAKKKRCKNWAMASTEVIEMCVADDCMGWWWCKLGWELEERAGNQGLAGDISVIIREYVERLYPSAKQAK